MTMFWLYSVIMLSNGFIQHGVTYPGYQRVRMPSHLVCELERDQRSYMPLHGPNVIARMQWCEERTYF